MNTKKITQWLLALAVPLSSTAIHAESLPDLWARPADNTEAIADDTSYFAWDVFATVETPNYSPDVASFGPTTSTPVLVVAENKAVITSTKNLYGLGLFGVDISVPSYDYGSTGWTTAFIQGIHHPGSAGEFSDFSVQTTTGTYEPIIKSNGGYYFQFEGSSPALDIKFSANAAHVSLTDAHIDTIWSSSQIDLSGLVADDDNTDIGFLSNLTPGGRLTSTEFTSTNSHSLNGFRAIGISPSISESGKTAGTAEAFVLNSNIGTRGLAWSPGELVVELPGLLATDTTQTVMVNNAGAMVGQSKTTPVLWDASNEVSALGMLSGASSGIAQAINDNSVIAGVATVNGELRAVRWDNGSATATDLGSLGTTSTNGNPIVGINNAGTIIGYHYDSNTQNQTALRWDAGSSSATVLDAYGDASQVRDINDNGVAIGEAVKDFFFKAVKWDASSSAVALLPSGNFLASDANAINEQGDIVGNGWNTSPSYAGGVRSPLIWKSGATEAIVGELLGTATNGAFDASILDINNAGFSVGYANADGAVLSELRATLWDIEGLILDLNTLIDSESGWILQQANKITDTGHIIGTGLFDPDGAGGQAAYARMFTLHAPQFSVVPEPASLTLIVLGGCLLTILRRKNRIRVVTQARPCGKDVLQ